MRALVLILLLIAAGGLAARAQSCTVSATTMSFPAYNAFSGNVSDASSVVTTTCSGILFIGVSYEVRLDGGQAGNILGRKMRLGATSHELSYQVYLNAGRTTVWGNGVQGSVYTGNMLLGLFSRTQTRTVYGRIPASQQVNSGDYADGPVMTVIY
jgi:spore coat protein U-like protein